MPYRSEELKSLLYMDSSSFFYPKSLAVTLTRSLSLFKLFTNFVLLLTKRGWQKLGRRLTNEASFFEKTAYNVDDKIKVLWRRARDTGLYPMDPSPLRRSFF